MNLRRDEYVLGIDFGYSESCAAFGTSREPDPITVPCPNGANLFRSCVQYGKNSDVGDAAYKHLSTRKSGIVKNVKMILGRYYDDEIVQRCKEKRLCAADIEEINKKPVFRIDMNTIVSPSDVASRIIQRIYEIADKKVKQFYGSDMRCVKVMITFPAYFNNNQRTALLLAAEKAGIPREKIKMMSEPTATAFHYCKYNRIDHQTILVYYMDDMAFDVSIVRVNQGDYAVLAFAADPFLGGNYFYQLFAEYIEKKCKYTFHDPLIRTSNENKRHILYAYLLSLAEEAVIELSVSDSTYIDVTGFGIDPYKKSLESDSDTDRSDDYSMKVTRSELNTCIRGLIDHTIDLIRQCLSHCGLKTSDIDQVLLTGEASHPKIVEERLKEFFGSWKVSNTDIGNPELAIARGACQSLAKNLDFKNRILYSLNKEIMKNNSHCLLPRLMKTDHANYKTETMLPNDRTRSMEYTCYQSNTTSSKDFELLGSCSLVGKYTIEGYSTAPEPEVNFLTTYTIDEWGIIHLKVESKENGQILVDITIRWEEPI